MYRELSGDSKLFTCQEVFEIAEGIKKGNKSAAIESFRMLGEVAGDTIAHASNLIDGLIVIGGALTIAHKYFIDSLIKEMSCVASTFTGDNFSRMCVKPIDLMTNFDELLKGEPRKIQIPFSDEFVAYYPQKLTGICISELGTSRAIALGAYNFALEKIDSRI